MLRTPGKGQQRGSWAPNLRSEKPVPGPASHSGYSAPPSSGCGSVEERRQRHRPPLSMTGRGCQKLQPRGLPRRTSFAPAPPRAGGCSRARRAGTDPLQLHPESAMAPGLRSGGQSTWAGRCNRRRQHRSAPQRSPPRRDRTEALHTGDYLTTWSCVPRPLGSEVSLIL